MRSLYWLAFALVTIGAINWGLVGLFDVDLVAAIFGVGTTMARLVYALVGVAGVILLALAASTSERTIRVTAPGHRGIP